MSMDLLYLGILFLGAFVLGVFLTVGLKTLRLLSEGPFVGGCRPRNVARCAVYCQSLKIVFYSFSLKNIPKNILCHKLQKTT